jgi:hypothetical protein
MLTKDRNDYRCMFDGDLVEEAKYNPTAELAVVLGERLDEYIAETPETQFLQDKLREAETLIGDLEDDVSYWKGMWEELKTKQRD